VRKKERQKSHAVEATAILTGHGAVPAKWAASMICTRFKRVEDARNATA